jgi:ATP/maltotriose-dependent transcriptional regulator MalT
VSVSLPGVNTPGRRDARPLERERELERLVGQLESARDGHGRVALVSAAAGLGKTTLLREAETLARERGLSVFSARGAELEREIPFGLTRQLLERVRGALRPEALDEAGRGAAGIALSLLDRPGAPTAGDIGGLLHGLYWFLGTACEQQPLLLCLDDVHWSDPETLRLLAYLAPRIRTLRLLVLCAARPVEPGVASGLLRAVAADEEVALATLQPLSVAATADLVVWELGASAAAGWVQTSHRITGGNPFFLRELLWTVRERGLPLTTDSAAALERMTTPRVSEAITARLHRAGPAAEAVAAATAVLSGDAELRRVADLADLSVGATQDAAEHLAEISILRSARPLEFVHPLVRTAVYDRLSARQRDELHRRAVALLHDDGASAMEIALHAFPIEPSGDEALVAALLNAAREAQNAGTPDAAVRYLRRALDEPPRPALRADVWFALGVALAASDARAASDALARAADSEDAQLRISALRWRGATLGFGGQPREAVAALDAALACARDPEEAMLLRATRDFHALAWIGDPDGEARADRVIADADGASEHSPGGRRLVALASWIVAASGKGSARRALELGHRAREAQGTWLAEDHGVETAASFGESSIVIEEPAALERHERALAATRDRGMAVNGATAMVQIADIRLRRGELLRAEVDARTAWRLLAPERERNVIFHWWSLAALIAVLVARGESAEADRLAAETSAWTVGSQEVGMFPFTPLLPVALGELALAAGRREEGVSRLRHEGEQLEAHGWRNPALVPWRAKIVPALVAAGRSTEARELIAPAVEQARRFGTPWALGMALRAAGTAEDGERRLALLQEAVAVLQSGGCQVEHAHARLELGASLRRANRRREGREHLRIALDLAVRSGAATLATRAREEIAATGARPRRELLSGLESLTASELRVAELAAEGRSNPAIAQELFVSRKTVEAHLHRAYAKLDIRGRDELPLVLKPAPTNTISADRPPRD